MKSVGIDLATGKTGLVLLEESGAKIPTLLSEQIVTYPELEGIERYKAICLHIMVFIHANTVPDDRIVIEGYSLNLKKASSVVPLVEVGGLLRFFLNLDGIRWLDPRATEVKKFTSGKGTTPKSMMIACVLQRWGHMSKDDNTADAYSLACMGLAHANRLPGVTKDMRALVGGLQYRKH